MGGGVLAFLIWIVLLFVTAISAKTIYSFTVNGIFLKNSGQKGFILDLVTTFLCWCVPIIIFLSPLVYNYPSTTATVIVKKNGELKIYPHGNVFCLEWGNNFCVDNNRRFGHEIKSPPILICSQASNVAYSIYVSVTNIEKFYKSLDASTKKSITCPILKSTSFINNVSWIVNDNLYEFNHTHMDEFTNFFNPINVEQQNKFAQMIRENLSEKLEKKGITINNAVFSLARPVYRE